MNMDHLKSVWKAHDAEPPALREDQLRQLLRKRSRTAIFRINRSIWIEVGLIIFILCAFFVSLFPFDSFESRLQGAWVVVFSLLSLAYYRYKFAFLNRSGIEALPLFDYVSEVTRRMRRFMRIYDAIIFVVFPLFLISGFFVGFVNGLNDAGKTLAEVTLLSWTLVILINVVLCCLIIGFGKGYIWLLYGRHFRELRKCLAELEAAGSAIGDFREEEE